MARIKKDIIDKMSYLDYEKLNQKNTLLVIVDMVNGFTKEGNMADTAIYQIVERHLALFKQLDKTDHLYFADAHLEDCQEFKSFPPHCIIGTTESRIVDELSEDSQHSTVIEKNSTNGFLAPKFMDNLDHWLQYDHFVITGCCSDICVLQFTLTLQTYIHQYNLDKDIYVVIDAIDTYHNPNGHDVYEYNKISVDLLKAAGVKVVKMKEGNKNEK